LRTGSTGCDEEFARPVMAEGLLHEEPLAVVVLPGELDLEGGAECCGRCAASD